MAYTVKDLKEGLEKLPENWEIKIDEDRTLYAEEPVYPHKQYDIFTD